MTHTLSDGNYYSAPYLLCSFVLCKCAECIIITFIASFGNRHKYCKMHYAKVNIRLEMEFNLYMYTSKGKKLRTPMSLSWISDLIMYKAAIPLFSIRIRIRIRIRVRNILMRTPYFTFQYPSNVASFFHLTFNCAYIILLQCIIYRKMQHVLSKTW